MRAPTTNIGIPTLHNGRQMRSRLEARWAAFFDLAGWRYEYEPFDLNGWIPDFLIMGAKPVLVEIKPVYGFPKEVAEKIQNSVVPREYEVLIVGCTIPADIMGSGDGSPDNHPCLGWIAERNYDGPSDFYWDDAVLGWWNLLQIGFCHASGGYDDRITGEHDGSWGDADAQSALALWTKAGNIVQWNKRGGK